MGGKTYLCKALQNYWQRLWDAQSNNKLHTIKPRLGNWPSTTKSRQSDVLFSRLRIGHTYGTHSYLLTGGEPPACGRCGEALSVLHVLLQCREAEPERRKHFFKAYQEHIPLHPALFLGVDPLFDKKSVLSFLRDVGTLKIICP